MASETTVQVSFYAEIADFLVSQPSIEALAAFKVPPSMQDYIDQMLQKNREDCLTSDERVELEKVMAIAHLMTVLKMKANLKIQGRSE